MSYASSLQNKISDLHERLVEKDAEIEQLRDTNGILLRQRVAMLETENEKLEGEISGLREENESYRAFRIENEGLNKRVAELKAENEWWKDRALLTPHAEVARLRKALEQAARDPYVSAKGTEFIYQALKGASDGTSHGSTDERELGSRIDALESVRKT